MFDVQLVFASKQSWMFVKIKIIKRIVYPNLQEIEFQILSDSKNFSAESKDLKTTKVKLYQKCDTIFCTAMLINTCYRFAEMNCQSFKEENAMISLKCSHTNQFYLMKPILSYGTSQNPSFTFKFASGSEVTYNDTEIIIEGQLSQALGAKTIKVLYSFSYSR